MNLDRTKQAAAEGLIKGGRLILTWLGLPLTGTLILFSLILIFFFGYAGLAQNLALAPVLEENKLNTNFKPVELSSANKELIKNYKETAYNTVPDRNVKDYYRQETAFRLTWGLLAALDTVIYQLDDRRNPADHARILMTTDGGKALFEYRDSKITVVTITENHTQGQNGKKKVTKSTKTDVKNVQLLTLARTFAGDFQHLYKETTTTKISKAGSSDANTVTTTVTTKESLAGIDVQPSTMASLRKILNENGLNDETDLDLVLGLADTYDEDDVNPDGTTKNFWQVAMEKINWPAGRQTPGNISVPGLPGSIGAGNLGSFPYWPTPGFNEISSPFGMRVHPIKNIISMHTGIDIAAPGSTPVIVAAPGIVIDNRYSAGYGNLVVIDHGDGVTTSYNHMQERSPLEVGTAVKAGQTAGRVGSTGMSTGNHLHFEVRLNGQYRDPLAYAFGK